MTERVNLHPEVCIRIAAIESLTRGFWDEWVNPRWAPKRQREFAAGRILARQMLSEMDIETPTLPSDPDRVPMWPQGITGSISHTDDTVAVAIAETLHMKCVGLDLEQTGAVSREVDDMLLVAEEREYAAGDRALVTRFFCAKESVYKAVFPIHHEFFDFRDIEVSFKADGFSAHCLNQVLASDNSIRRGTGMVTETRGHCLSLFHL